MNYHNITYPDMNNGEGLRVVLWLSGCSHKCKGCQNPQTWNANSGIPFDESAKEELFKELDKDYISGLTLSGGDPLFESNLDGVLELVAEVNKQYNSAQYIVGDDKNNHNILNANANKIRLSSPKKSIWLYTGFYWEEIFEPAFTEQSTKWINNYLKQNKIRKEIISNCDVLVDGKYIDSQRDITLKWCGSKNQRVIDINKTIKEGEIIEWKR